MTTARRAAVALAAIVAVVVVALAGVFDAAASTPTVARTGNAVAAFTVDGGQVVGTHPDILPGERRARAPGYDRTAVGSSVATEGELSGTALARQLGAEGESLIEGAGNTTRIQLPGGGYRIPDILDEAGGVIGEVKNVQSLSYTSQLRDYVAYAQRNGFQFDLYVRGGTRLSGPLQQAIDDGFINLFRALP